MDEKVAVVTGAASGIGRAVAARLEADGWSVLAADLEPDEHGPGSPLGADLTTREGNRDAVAAALERFGRLDAVVANAGFQHVAPVEEFPEDTWDAIIALLLTSPFLLAKAAWPALRESGEGRFVAIASAHALVASPFKSAYVSAKHGVLGLMRTLALELGPQRIRVNSVLPTNVNTPMFMNEGAYKLFRPDLENPGPADVAEIAAAFMHVLPVGWVEPEDISNAILFLVSDEARYITGVALPVDAGALIK
jgi:3-hydroxybutyrate dehydrogenase